MVAVGRSIAVRNTKAMFRPTPKRRAAWRREAIEAAYEMIAPEMLESGEVGRLLEEHRENLGGLLYRIQHKYNMVAADGMVLFKAGALSRWRECYAQLHARSGELVLYRCASDESKRRVRAAAAFGALSELALPDGVTVVDVLDITGLRAATVVDERSCVGFVGFASRGQGRAPPVCVTSRERLGVRVWPPRPEARRSTRAPPREVPLGGPLLASRPFVGGALGSSSVRRR